MSWDEMSPFQKLIKSRKFWLMVLDVLISTVAYFVTIYTKPEVAEQIIWVIGTWQPVIVALILGIAHEDAAEKNSAAMIASELQASDSGE